MKPIINVQFMRAVAALAVLIYHFSILLVDSGDSTNHWFYYAFNQIGYAGVDFFFVISGYIMWITTQHKHPSHPVLNFAYKRATRIYFGYWPYFLLALLIVSFYPNLITANTHLLGSFFLTELNTANLLIQVAWTLQYELYFYLIFALLMFLPRHRALDAIVALTLIIIGLQVFKTINGGFLVTSQDEPSLVLNFFFSPFCLEFFAGCSLGRFFQNHRVQHWPAVLFMGLGLLAFTIYIQEAYLGTSLAGSEQIILRVTLFGSAAVLLLATVIELEMRGRILLKKLSTILGGASYSIYLSHTLVIALIAVWGGKSWITTSSENPAFWIFLFMLLTVLYSILHYLWIEKPLMSLAKHLQILIFGGAKNIQSQSPK